ncbi:hypothetical protein PMIN04_009019 [Paraphaeosphaeria minitans]
MAISGPQQQVFDYVNEQTEACDVRVFPIGIGGGVSSSLIEGIARSGRGFSQMVAENEKLDRKIVRTLKGALTPHIKDYRLEVTYDDDSVESVTDSRHVTVRFEDKISDKTDVKPVSLYDTEAVRHTPNPTSLQTSSLVFRKLIEHKILQTPHEISPLFPFNRTCLYLLMSPTTVSGTPKSVVPKGTSPQGPLELEIPVEAPTALDQMIHQLAARKAIQELKEGRGWITEVITEGEKPGETISIGEKYPAKTALLQRREAVRLGVEFQVGGKLCSFVAVESKEAEMAEKRRRATDRCVRSGFDEEDRDWDIVGNHFDAFKSQCPTSEGSDKTPEEEGDFQSVGVRGSRSSHVELEAEVEEEEQCDDSDKDMDFGLFDSGTPPASDACYGRGALCLNNPASADSWNNAPSRFFKRNDSSSGGETGADSASLDKGMLLEGFIAEQSFEGSWTPISMSLRKKIGIDLDVYSKAVNNLVKSEYSLD